MSFTMEIPKNFYRYKQTDVWTNETIPELILHRHNTKAGVYGKIMVMEGALEYTVFRDVRGEIDFTAVIEAGSFGIAAPGQWHQVAPIGQVKMMVEFYCEKPANIQAIEQAFWQKFPDMNPHHEIKTLITLEDLTGKEALDLGS